MLRALPQNAGFFLYQALAMALSTAGPIPAVPLPYYVTHGLNVNDFVSSCYLLVFESGPQRVILEASKMVPNAAISGM